jgi:hypothetical protein
MERLCDCVTGLIVAGLLLLRVWNQLQKIRIDGNIRKLARRYAPDAIDQLARLGLKAKSEHTRIAAIRELLDRGYGRVSAPDNNTVHNSRDL